MRFTQLFALFVWLHLKVSLAQAQIGTEEFTWRHGVVVSTLDFESRSPSSNLGGASTAFTPKCMY